MVRYLCSFSLILVFCISCQEKHTDETPVDSNPTKVGHQESSESFIIELVKTSQSLSIDGKLSEDIWKEAPVLTLKNNSTGKPVEDQSYISYAQCTYDEDNLYIAFVNKDKNIHTSFTKKDEFLWQDEVVEVFIDGDPNISTYIELEVSPTNVIFDSYITDTLDIDLVETPLFDIEGLQTAVVVDGTVNDSTDTDIGWTVEILIPLKVITQKRTDGKAFLDQYQINFFRINRDSEGPGNYAWSPTYARFHAPARFGVMVLDH